MKCSEKFLLNKRLFPVKATYFVTLGGVAALLPYLAVYMRQIGLTPPETAIIYGTMPFIGAFVRSFIGALADKLGKHKLILIVVCFLSGVLHACLLFVPPVAKGDCNIHTTINCGTTSSGITFCPDSEVAVKNREPSIISEVDVLNSTNLPVNPGTEYVFPESSGYFTDCSIKCDPVSSMMCFNHNMSMNDCVNGNCATNSSLTCFSAQTSNVSYSESGKCFQLSLNEFLVEPLFKNKSFLTMSCLTSSELSCQFTCTGKKFQTKGWTDCSQEAPYSRTFWIFFWIFLLAQMAFAPVFSLIDAMTYCYLGEERGKWGWNRLWGTVGFAVFAVLSAITMEVFQKSEQEKNYTYSFVLFAVLNITASVIVYFYKYESEVVAAQVLKNVGVLLRKIDVLALLIAVFAFGAYTGLIETFLYWHLETLGGGKVLIGLCMVVNCLPEILVLLVAGATIKYLGHVICLYIVFLAYGIRLLVYSFLTNPWYALTAEPLHSITFGLMYAVVTSYGSLITPPGMHGTVQGLIGALYFGAGKGVGSVLGGFIFGRWGPIVTFQSYAVSAFLLLVMYFCLHCFYIRPRKKQEKKKGTVEERDNKIGKELQMLNGSVEIPNETAQKPARKEDVALLDKEEKCQEQYK